MADIETGVKDTSTTRTLTLLPDDFTNDMFVQNISYLKTNQPALYNEIFKHKCRDYRLCSNADGSPNIVHMQNMKLVYSASSLDEILTPTRQKIEHLYCQLKITQSFMNSCTEKFRIDNPIQIKMLDELYQVGILHEMGVHQDNLSPLQNYSTDYFPLLRVYGIGLGYHLTELIKKKKISHITIYEPHLDLFYTSLYTIPWPLIFKYFGAKGKGIHLVIGVSPETATQNNMLFIQSKLVPLTNSFYQFNHFNNSPIIAETIVKAAQTDELQRKQLDAGWYDDQRIGFYYSARNIKKGNQFYSGQKIAHYARAFVVGSGPSLNDSIDYIKSHQDQALIISCGTAINPLLNAGIIPDYQVVQERNWHVHTYEEKCDAGKMQQISLLKLNVVSPKIDKHFKETLVFQKLNDPGSSLLDDNYTVTALVNPTVTNAGISMAADLGVNEIYLFGIDYGAPAHCKTMHAANTIYEASLDDTVATKTSFEVPGNLGTVILTSEVLNWSLKTSEQRIAMHPQIQWFNVAEGAFISGTIPLAVEDFPAKFPQKINKPRLRREISACFNNLYSPEAVLTQIKTLQMQHVTDYFQAIIGFTDSCPQSREDIVYVLSLLYNAMNTGADKTHFLPTPLLSYGLKQFINNVYIQTSLTTDDSSAEIFFKKTKQILLDYINDITMDLEMILAAIESEPEMEFYT